MLKTFKGRVFIGQMLCEIVALAAALNLQWSLGCFFLVLSLELRGAVYYIEEMKREKRPSRALENLNPTDASGAELWTASPDRVRSENDESFRGLVLELAAGVKSSGFDNMLFVLREPVTRRWYIGTTLEDADVLQIEEQLIELLNKKNSNNQNDDNEYSTLKKV